MLRHLFHRLLPARLAACLAATLAVGVGTAADLLPDLTIDGAAVAADIWIDRATIPGATLLRMPTVVANRGSGPLEIRGGSLNGDGTQNVDQRIYQGDGTFRDRLAGTFVHHPTHGHIHFEDFAQFRLRARNADGSVGGVVREGAKISFCLMDISHIDPGLPGSPTGKVYNSCFAERQGISVGWADIYGSGLPDQWVDITGVPVGQYWIEVISDPANHMVESNEGNNSAYIPYTIANLDNRVTGQIYDDRNINNVFDAGDVPLPGWTAWLDLDNDGARDQGVQTHTTTEVPVDILDLRQALHELEVSGVPGVISDIDVSIRLNHTYVNDLRISLISPSGRRVVLIDNVGGGGDNIVTTLSDEAATALSAGSPPFTGTFRPLQRLWTFDGQSANGHWKLEIADQVGSDVGQLLGWSLTIRYSEPSAITDPAGVFTLGSWSDGAVTVRAQRQANWVGPTPSSWPLTLAGGTQGGLLFGFWHGNVVTGVVYEDFNRNRRRDVGEEGLAGWTIYDDANNNGVFDRGAPRIFAGDTPMALPDRTLTSSRLFVGGLQAPIRDLDVFVDLVHTYTGDLTLTLVTPGGRRLLLFNRHGAGGDNITTRFNDEAALGIASGTPPFTGSFKPVQPLSAFDRLSPNGAWRLEVNDLAGGDVGTLRSWSLRIEHAELSAITRYNGTYTLGELRPGSYRIRQVMQPGYTQTVPSAGGFYPFTFTLGQSGTAVFGNYPGVLLALMGNG